jgi:hypothetical protein
MQAKAKTVDQARITNTLDPTYFRGCSTCKTPLMLCWSRFKTSRIVILVQRWRSGVDSSKIRYERSLTSLLSHKKVFSMLI